MSLFLLIFDFNLIPAMKLIKLSAWFTNFYPNYNNKMVRNSQADRLNDITSGSVNIRKHLQCTLKSKYIIVH